MTSILEKAISIIAPHRCLSCGKENNILCIACGNDVFLEPEPSCGFCDRLTKNGAVCRSCRPGSPLGHIWIAGSYEGTVAYLIKHFKFNSLRAAAEPLAAGMARLLPVLGHDTIIVPVPTAPQRIRTRGFDQTVLLARELHKQTGLAYAHLLRRNHNLRQLGMSRAMRQRQARDAFIAVERDYANVHILLIDDVITTGATLNAAAKALRAAGAQQIDAVVIAKQTALK